MSYHDHIYPNYKEETVLILRDPTMYKILENPNYEPLIIALRKGPLTVKELEARYNEIVKERVDVMDLSLIEKELLIQKLIRKSKTLYKYLNKLEEHGFIVPAGKRIVENQTASETLYGRTAKLFFDISAKAEWGESKEFDDVLKLLSQVIGLMNKTKGPTKSSLKKLLNGVTDKMNSDIENLFAGFSTELSEIAENVHYNELKLMMFGLNILLLMKNYQDFEKELRECKVI